MRHGPADCPLCVEIGGELVWANERCRVVLVDDSDYPGYVRVILNAHLAEMTDLEAAERSALMAVVWCVEAVLREQLKPEKINLASLGNVVPHLHWHVIARWQGDRHFPQPIWGAPQRTPCLQPIDRGQLSASLRSALAQLAES